MIQGDEPMVSKEMIDISIKPFLKDKKVNIVNLLGKIKDNKELNDKSYKSCYNKFNRAIYSEIILVK